MRTFHLLVAVAIACVLTGCGWFGGGSSKKSESVFGVKVGQCFTAPKEVKAQLSELSKVDCSAKHTQEAYAVIPFSSPDGSTASAYPGSDKLATFAKGACAQHFASYVGVDYLDSSLFFTYLLPSARSWQQSEDRQIICFVTTTGGTLDASVKGSKK